MMDYAHYCETLLGHQCIIVTPKNHQQNSMDNNECAYRWIANRFPILFTDSENTLIKNQVDLIYVIKHGQKDDIEFNTIPYVVHCVFDMTHPHGKVYAAVSETLAKKFNATSWVPHIVSMNAFWSMDDLRPQLSIPPHATVFGRYGGLDTFNLDFAKGVISHIVRHRPDVYFLFMNTPQWDNHPQIIHLPAISNQNFKKRFIKTCDAMVVPETMGHTFGLSIAEFQTFRKPILCYNHNLYNTAHIDILGDEGRYFKTHGELLDLIQTFDNETSTNMYRRFNPDDVIERFHQVFLQK